MREGHSRHHRAVSRVVSNWLCPVMKYESLSMSMFLLGCVSWAKYEKLSISMFLVSCISWAKYEPLLMSKRDVNSKSFSLLTNALMDLHQLTLKNCYIKDLIVRSCRDNGNLLIVLKVKRVTFVRIAFKRAAPDLPSSLRKSKSVYIFKSGLKTLLFKRAFNL